MFVIQVVTTIGCIISTGINVRSYRRWRREVDETEAFAAMIARANLALIERSIGWLTCDDCSTTLGPHSGIGFAPDPDARAGTAVLCGACGRARTSRNEPGMS